MKVKLLAGLSGIHHSFIPGDVIEREDGENGEGQRLIDAGFALRAPDDAEVTAFEPLFEDVAGDEPGAGDAGTQDEHQAAQAAPQATAAAPAAAAAAPQPKPKQAAKPKAAPKPKAATQG